MATVSITIPTADVQRVQDALCASAGLPSTAANAKAAILQYVISTVKNVEYTSSQKTAIAGIVPLPDPAVT